MRKLILYSVLLGLMLAVPASARLGTNIFTQRNVQPDSVLRRTLNSAFLDIQVELDSISSLGTGRIFLRGTPG